MQHDPISTIFECAQALRDGRDPIEVADMLDGLGDGMTLAMEGKGVPAGYTLTEASSDINLIMHRVADLEVKVDTLAAAMREVAKKESLHPSVRFLADTIALNLAVPTGAPVATNSQTEPPPGWTVSPVSFEDGTYWYCRATVKEPGFRAEDKQDAVNSAWAWHNGQVQSG